MLYRLDTPSGPVHDLIGVALLPRYADARRLAHKTCADTGEVVTITRIGNSGALSHAATVKYRSPSMLPARGR